MTSDPIRTALWIVPVSDLGGVARHVLDVTRHGLSGWRLVVLCPAGPLAEKLRAQGSAVTTGPFGPSAGVLSSLRTLQRTARAVQPTIVHSHLAYADFIVAAARLPKRTRRFTTEHGIAGDDRVYHRSSLESRVMAMLHRVRFRRFHGVVAVSRATRAAMIRKWKVAQHIDVIPNGVDGSCNASPHRQSAPAGLRILSLSRLAPEKRIDRLIDAFELLRHHIPQATLTIAGDGPLRNELKSDVARRDLSGAIFFPGFIDPDKAMDDADVLVQLSTWENCSYSLLDAAAKGMRIVASAVGGNSEILPSSALIDMEDAHTIAHRIEIARSTQRADIWTIGAMCARLEEEYARLGLDLAKTSSIV